MFAGVRPNALRVGSAQNTFARIDLTFALITLAVSVNASVQRPIIFNFKRALRLVQQAAVAQRLAEHHQSDWQRGLEESGGPTVHCGLCRCPPQALSASENHDAYPTVAG